VAGRHLIVDNDYPRAPQSDVAKQLEEQTFLLLVRAAGWLMQGVNEILREHDLTSTQFNILRILRGAGPEGLACAEIGVRMLERDPDVTRLLDRLERRGLTQRNRSTEDRRVVFSRITPAGLAVLAALDEPMLAQHQRSMRHLTRAQVIQLHSLLESLHQPAAG
jgi:DNA-binding MarR family transcriptional regulator